MTRHHFLCAGLLLATASALSGCVVAAIPVVAGGLMVGGSGNDAAESKTTSGSAKVDAPIAAVNRHAQRERVATTPPTVELAAVTVDPTEEAAGRSDISVADATPGPPDATPVRATAVALPQPASVGSRDPLSMRAYDAFYSYVDTQARRDPVERARDSALLSSPGLLRPDRTECSIRPPAVVLDLDPGDSLFDHSVAALRNNALGQMLASMRMQEIEIFWISSVPAVQAGAVRRSLAASGLDPDGKDSLLLMRKADDRKQERRRELAGTHCVVAIAGDTRADFDELYSYLKDRNAAQPLEELVGAGWFLTPLPIEQGQ